MNKTLQWTIGVGVILIALAMIASVILPFVAPQLGWAGYGSYGGGMMGPGHMVGGGPMMGGFGMPFFGVGMFLGPLLFIGLIIVGAIWLVRVVTPAPPAATSVCGHCGKPVQPGWKACPYCGEKL